MGAPRRVVVDDTDSRIRYSGQGWFQDQGSQDGVGNFGPTYKRTSHGTNGNDSLSFTFEGTSINVVGTTNLASLDNGTRWDPSWECFVDKISIGSTKPFPAAENNWGLCGQGILNDGQHEITINVTSTGHTFWVDYLVFTPSPKVSYDEAVLTVENDDPGIFLDSSWGSLGDVANMTTRKGSQAKFDFVGKSVTWVGFVPTELPHAAASGSFTIDGGSSITFKLNGLPSDATTTVYNQAFFTTPDLTPGPHTLVVTYDGASGPATPLTLDYLYVTNTSTPNSSSAGSTTAANGPSNVPDASQNNTTGSKTPVGAIVGGVVGGLALIALVLFIFWWRRRQHRQAVHVKSVSNPGGNGTAPYEVTPFMSSYPSSDPTYNYSKAPVPPQPLRAPAFTMSSSGSGSGSGSGSSQQRYGAQNYGQNSTQSQNQLSSFEGVPSSNSNNISHSAAGLHAHNSSMDSSDVSGYVPGTVAQTRAMRKGQEVTAAAAAPTVTSVVHQDSGIRLQHPTTNVIVEDIPPQYTAT